MDSALIKSILEKIGIDILVTFFVPALGFIVAFAIAFYPILPFPYFDGDLTQFVRGNFVILQFVVVILGFILYLLSTYIYKLFEGYTFILASDTALGRSFLRRQEWRFKRLAAAIIDVEKQLLKISQKIERESMNTKIGIRQAKLLDEYAKERTSLQSRRYYLLSIKNESFPPSFDLLLPTRFGNRLRAAEMYAGTRYAIDGVTIWGRLAQVMPKEYTDKIHKANNQCLFFLNAAVLTMIFTLLCVLASTYEGLNWWAATKHIRLLQSIDYTRPFLYQEGMWRYIVLAILAGWSAWFLYEASLLKVSQFGGMIRASYDLYRFNLLEALHLELPADLRAERRLWRRVSYFMVGNDQGKELEELEMLEGLSEFEGIDFSYHHPKKQNAYESGPDRKSQNKRSQSAKKMR